MQARTHTQERGTRDIKKRKPAKKITVEGEPTCRHTHTHRPPTIFKQRPILFANDPWTVWSVDMHMTLHNILLHFLYVYSQNEIKKVSLQKLFEVNSQRIINIKIHGYLKSNFRIKNMDFSHFHLAILNRKHVTDLLVSRL